MPVVSLPDYGGIAPIAFGFEVGIPYVLTGPRGHRVCFNDSTDPDFIGRIEEITGLDGPDTRESAENIVEGDGGRHGDFYHGRRPITISGQLDADTFGLTQNQRVTKLLAATNAMRQDAVLSWTPTGGIPMSLRLRRQNSPRIAGGRVKSFLVSMVCSDAEIFSDLLQYEQTVALPPRRNLIPNPSFETDASGWTRTATSWTASASSRVAVGTPWTGSDGGFVLSVTGTKDATGTNRVLDMATAQLPVTVGVDYTLKANVNVSAAGSVGSAVVIEWRTAAGANISFSTGTFQTGTGVKVLSVNGVAPPTAAYAVCSLRTSSSVSSQAVAAVWDAILFERTDTLDRFFPNAEDLSSGNVTWTGTSWLKRTLSGSESWFTSPLQTGFTAQPGAEGLMIVNNLGNTDSPPILRLRGPMKNPTITHLDTGEKLVLNYTLLAGQTLDLDCRDATIVLDGETNRYSALDFVQSDWWKLAPGINQIQLTCTDWDEGAALVIYWNHAFI